MQSSLTVEQLLLTTLQELQDSPGMTEDDVRSLQQFALYLIAEFNTLKETQGDEAVHFPCPEFHREGRGSTAKE